MEPAGQLGLLIAFGAGLLSFLSPCVLPLVPSYITFITGMTLEDMQQTRRETITHALVAALRTTHANGVVVVAAHSDSAPKIVAALGAANAITIAHEEYDNLFVVVPGAGPTPTFLRLRY